MQHILQQPMYVLMYIHKSMGNCYFWSIAPGKLLQLDNAFCTLNIDVIACQNISNSFRVRKHRQQIGSSWTCNRVICCSWIDQIMSVCVATKLDFIMFRLNVSMYFLSKCSHIILLVLTQNSQTARRMMMLLFQSVLPASMLFICTNPDYCNGPD